MTPQELEEQSKKAVIAYLQDSSVRLECKPKLNNEWENNETDRFIMDIYYYRIAQPKPWVRVALFKDGGVETVHNSELAEKVVADYPQFVKWLTDRVEYTND